MREKFVGYDFSIHSEWTEAGECSSAFSSQIQTCRSAPLQPDGQITAIDTICASRHFATMTGVVMVDRELPKAGTLEKTYFKRHSKRTNCDGKVAERRGSWLFGRYYCKTCGKCMTR
jgi:hypothetical protein